MAPMPPMMPMMPPPYYYPPPPPPPPKPRGGFVRGIFVTLATSILGISLALNAYLLLFVGLTGGGASSQTNVIVEGDAKQRVAVISIDNVITGETSKRFEKLLREVEADPTIKALVVELDTPGGEVTASDEIYQRLERFKKEKGMKVVVTMGSMATSGGYYIACAGDYLFAQPTTLTGNIGVVLQRFNFSELMDKWGVKEASITPGESKYKNSESPFKPETPEAHAYLQNIAEQIYTRFRSIVETSRASQIKSASASMDVVADGRAFTADEAKKLGLVDEIDYASAAYAKAASLAGISGKPQVVRFQHTPNLIDLLGGGSASSGLPGGASASARPEINVKIDANLLNEVSTPKFLYLYRGE